jgi:hypothetical protein
LGKNNVMKLSLLFAMLLINQVAASFRGVSTDPGSKGGNRRLMGMSASSSTDSTDLNAVCLEPEECCICYPDNKVRPPQLVFKYHSVGQNPVHQTKSDCGAGTYPEEGTVTANGVTVPVKNGEEFVIPGEFEANTDFLLEGLDGSSYGCTIHTSCSQPLVQGDYFGPYELLAGNDCTEEPPQCIVVDKQEYTCNENIVVSYDFAGVSVEPGETIPAPKEDDWVGIYPCDTEPSLYMHAEVWKFAATNSCTNGTVPISQGQVNFDSLPKPCNEFNALHKFPFGNGCFKAVLLRWDGPSVPPYISVCESPAFNVTGCR